MMRWLLIAHRRPYDEPRPPRHLIDREGNTLCGSRSMDVTVSAMACDCWICTRQYFRGIARLRFLGLRSGGEVTEAMRLDFRAKFGRDPIDAEIGGATR